MNIGKKKDILLIKAYFWNHEAFRPIQLLAIRKPF